jgi:hypothetical protein
MHDSFEMDLLMGHDAMSVIDRIDWVHHDDRDNCSLSRADFQKSCRVLVCWLGPVTNSRCMRLLLGAAAEVEES